MPFPVRCASFSSTLVIPATGSIGGIPWVEALSNLNMYAPSRPVTYAKACTLNLPYIAQKHDPAHLHEDLAMHC